MSDAASAGDKWLSVTVPSFMAAHPVYAKNPTLALLLDALVREQEEIDPDINLDAELLQASHETLVRQARILVAALEPME